MATSQIADANRLQEDLDPFLSSLNVNRSIFFDCSLAVDCIQARITVPNFKVIGNVPILISLNFTVNLEAMSTMIFW